MEALKAKTKALGAPRLEGTEKLDNRDVPILYFGTTKINDSFAVVDAVKQEFGGTATLFVKLGELYIRVSTNVLRNTGERAVGTVLDPKGKAIVAINKGESFFGEVTIFGRPYITGYVPITNEKGETLGIYYVGYLKNE